MSHFLWLECAGGRLWQAMFHGIWTEPSTTEEGRQKNIRRGSKLKHEEKNPCLKEHDMSFKCLEESSYNRNACGEYFENYKKCKEFWGNVRSERRRAGIVPHLPPAEERDKIKAEYLENRRRKYQQQQQQEQQ
ncbi:coiled-coil-helix-coiled-coil-helix domain-containing protein 7-like isoform X1 [Scylla paramamosain]|uniref:coiled-coil-helix-coiled-coil-helix domain-containing protein 7-like isoform X1 n=1 Tax=Scylla paramamosain TaxID=85552 RepID=UPI0030834830